MSAPRRPGRRQWTAGVAVALVLAAVVSFYASSQPDGLERVAEDQGFLDTARHHDLADSPLADYGVDGVDDERTSVGLAGVAGVVLTLAVGAGVFRLLRRPDRAGDGDVGGDGDGPDAGRPHTARAAAARPGESAVPERAEPGG